jgi:integrase
MMAAMMAAMTTEGKATVTDTKPRRDYGAGGMYQRADTGRWVAVIEAGWTARGTRRRVTVTGKGCPGGCAPRCHHRADIKRKLRDKRNEIERDGHTDASARTTVKGWSETWLPMVERSLTPNAYTATASAVRRWIIPTIGHKRLDALNPGDVRAVADAQRKAGRTSSTQRRTHSVLKSMLKAAVDEGHAVPQRVLAVKPPPRSVSDRDAIPSDDAHKIIDAACRLPSVSRWLAALLQGMRQGEALGLTWDEVDLDAETITVSWQLQTLRYRIPRDRTSGFRIPDGYEARRLDGAMHLVRPKSRAGWRVIPIIDPMRVALEQWRTVAPASPHGLVWPTADGRPTYYKADDADWYALQDAAKVRHSSGRHYTIHEARHTVATLLLEAGVDPAVVTAILGHSSILTSRGYQHVRTHSTREGLERVAEALGLPQLLSAYASQRGTDGSTDLNAGSSTRRSSSR